jgi:hypothetical protein
VNELIELAEKYCGEQNYQSAIMKKILEQIQKEKMQTEYNRTEVQERAGNLKDAL